MNDEDLRDFFAGLALIGLVTNVRDPKHTATWCYEMADAMIEAKYAEQEEPEVGIAAVVKRTRKKNVENT
jgi:hypothetical protein